MRSLYIVMLAVLAASAADDPGGWTKAKWGMTEPQIADAFGKDAVRLDPPEKISDIQVHLAVPVDLAGVQFRALMVPDAAGKLDSVLIDPVNQSDANDGLYQSLQELLVQKYGQPWKASEELGISELQWTVGTTVITLTRGKLPLTDQRIVNIHYRKKSSDLDKM